MAKRLLIFAVFVFAAVCAPAQVQISGSVIIENGSTPLTLGPPQVLLPSHVFAMNGLNNQAAPTEEFNIYNENLIQGFYAPYWYRYSNIQWTQFSSTNNCGIQLTDRLWFEPNNLAGNANSNASFFNCGVGERGITVHVYDNSGSFGQTNTLLAQQDVYLEVADPTVTTNAVRLLAVGDSLSSDYGSLWVTQAKGELQGGNVSTVGTRSLNSTMGGTNVFHEGRPGWTLAQYLTQFGSTTGPDSPFLFPNGVSATNYRGNTTFWKQAIANAANSGSPYYGFGLAATEGAGGTSWAYNSSTGYPLSPSTGWVVYDPTLSAGTQYQTWNGSAWVAMGTQPSGVTFSFANYVTRYAWAFPAGGPTHVMIMLGTNDFPDQGTPPTGTNWTNYKAYYDAFIASIQAYSGSTKLAVTIPPAASSQDGVGWVSGFGLHSIYLADRSNMQSLAASLITAYDTSGNRTAGLWVVSHLTDVDPVYGWPFSCIQPNKFTTSAIVPNTGVCSAGLVPMHNNSVHPYSNGVGFKQMGDEAAAWIQYTR